MASLHQLTLIEEVQIASCRNVLVNFICHQLEFQQPRNDYKEFLELFLIFISWGDTCSWHSLSSS